VRFAVVIPSFNYAKYLPAALASVLAQDAVDEVLVQDNRSNDGTLELLAAEADPRLRWWSEPDRGQSEALNRVLSRTAADIVGWLNADEFYAQNALAIARDTFTRNPDVQVLYGDPLFCDAHGRLVRLVSAMGPRLGVMEGHGCYITTCAMFFRRSVWESHPFDEDLRAVMDWDWYVRTLRAGVRYAYIPVPMGMFRLHERQVTASESTSWGQRLLNVRTSGEHLALRRKLGQQSSRLHLVSRIVMGDLTYRRCKRRAGGYVRDEMFHSARGEDLEWMWRIPNHVDRVQADAIAVWRNAGSVLQF
jgi:glycosyltransferase involved in cell wall biosynthesis